MSEPEGVSLPWLTHVARTDSTNAALLRAPFAAQPAPPRALLADQQTAGRGRQGRMWWTDPTASLALSVALEHAGTPHNWLGLPVALGVAVAEVLMNLGAAPRLKWPNDLYVTHAQGWAKAGGLLVELRRHGAIERLVLGCGLNLRPSTALQHALSKAAPSVGGVVPPGALFMDEYPPRLGVAQTLAQAMAHTATQFARTGLAPWRDRWAKWDLLHNQSVCVQRTDGSRLYGHARGLDDHGALWLEHPDGQRERLHSAEVSVRRV